jgi:hypothetical protein
VILGDKWVLTAAHNVREYVRLIEEAKNLKRAINDKSYVKLAVHEGSSHGAFTIENIYISMIK